MSKNKKIKQSVQVNGNKIPRSIENPNSFFDESPKWSFQYCDYNHEQWGIDCNFDILPDLFLKFRDFERMTRRDILTTTSGRKSNTRNHPIPLSNLIADAQKRFTELNLSEIFDDEIYSLALTNKLRLFGFIDERGIFSLIWIDKNHGICPSLKKHT